MPTATTHCQFLGKLNTMLGSFRITDVVKNLLIINILMFVATSIEPLVNYQDYLILWNPLYDPKSGETGFLGLQLVTHMFMHGDGWHIFFNMLFLFFCGPILESRLGAKKFFIFYFASGFGSLGLYILSNYFIMENPSELYMMLGASGAVYGVAVGAVFTDPNQRIIFPFPIRLIYLVGIMLTMDILRGFDYMPQSNTAYFAHIGGAFMGYFLLEYIMPKINI